MDEMDVAMRLGGFMVMRDAELGKLHLALSWTQEEPEIVYMGIKSVLQKEFDVVWRVGREVLANAACNNERSSEDPDFVIEPTEQALADMRIPNALRGTMFCHLTGLDFLGEESHEHIIFSGAALREFLGYTEQLIPIKCLITEGAVDRFLEQLFS